MSESSVNLTGFEELSELLHKLEALLLEEYEAIRHRNAERIESLAQTKQILVGELNQITQAGSDQLKAALTDTTNRNGETIRQLLQDCDRANRRNGQAIETSQSFTRNLLDIFRGRRPGQGTYTASGQLGGANDGASLIRV